MIIIPRNARKKSSTGIYHVILRGINKQIIFEEDEDYEKFLYTLNDCKEKSGCKIYAYCLMSNHIHILIKEKKEELGITFRRIGASYVYWHNWKYYRKGHLFQDRYKSEVVETDQYFLTVLRYIHQNPVKAGIIKKVDDYPWSSYHEYIEKPRLCDTEFAFALFSGDVELFKVFNHENNQDQCMDYDEIIRLNDIEATEIIKKLSGVRSPGEIQNFTKEKRNKVLKNCREEGLSIRQLERLTGISFGIIRRA